MSMSVNTEINDIYFQMSFLKIPCQNGFVDDMLYLKYNLCNVKMGL